MPPLRNVLGKIKHTPLLQFESSAFAPMPGDDVETNAGIYGKALAVWLADRLRAMGVCVDKILAEDFAWCLQIESGPRRMYVACSNLPGSTEQWQVFAFAERGVLAWHSGADKRAASLAALFSAIRGCLESATVIGDLREAAH